MPIQPEEGPTICANQDSSEIYALSWERRSLPGARRFGLGAPTLPPLLGRMERPCGVMRLLPPGGLARRRAGRGLEYDADHQARTRMFGIDQVILAINETHVHVLRVPPVRRPRIKKPEIIAAITEA